MNEYQVLQDKLRHQPTLSYESFPDIELYKDQVLSYLSRQPLSLREGDQLTAAMINNYVKDGLMPRPNGKKYAREHLAYLSMINRLKQVLSVKDTDVLIKQEMKGADVGETFNCFTALLDEAFDKLAGDLEQGGDESLSAAALRLAVAAYVNKLACEYLVDRIAGKAEAKRAQTD